MIGTAVGALALALAQKDGVCVRIDRTEAILRWQEPLWKQSLLQASHPLGFSPEEEERWDAMGDPARGGRPGSTLERRNREWAKLYVSELGKKGLLTDLLASTEKARQELRAQGLAREKAFASSAKPLSHWVARQPLSSVFQACGSSWLNQLGYLTRKGDGVVLCPGWVFRQKIAQLGPQIRPPAADLPNPAEMNLIELSPSAEGLWVAALFVWADAIDPELKRPGTKKALEKAISKAKASERRAGLHLFCQE